MDHWTQKLKRLVDSDSTHGLGHTIEIGSSGNSLCLEPWEKLSKLLSLRPSMENLETPEWTQWIHQIVEDAYKCVEHNDCLEMILSTFGAELGSKAVRALKFIARPMMDCRMLRNIAYREPNFRSVRISVVPPTPKIGIVFQDCKISILDAWARLTCFKPTGEEAAILTPKNQWFRKACSKSYSLHAEMQLYVHHENHPPLTPTLPYIGCSKKTCLLCSGFLYGLPDPIGTRGRHGICYPAWCAPTSESKATKTALAELEKTLVIHARAYIDSRLGRKPNSPVHPAVAQSSLVSSIPDSAERVGNLDLASRAEKAQREIRCIM